MDISQEIERFITGDLARGKSGNGLQADASLIERGVIDSMAILQLVAFIEDRYSVKVEDSEITVDNFETIQAMSEMIQKKLHGRGL